jgi:hypothetical protein
MTADELLKLARENGLETTVRGVNQTVIASNIGIGRPIDPAFAGMSEREFQTQIVDFAHLCRWTVVYFRPARVVRNGHEKYETPIGGDGKGWPDTIMLREDRLVAAEIKREGGKATAEQMAWLDRFNLIPGCSGFLWFPSDWTEIVRTLS